MKQEVEPVHGALNPGLTFGSFYGFVSFPHKEQTLNLAGIDLHKKIIRICVVNEERDSLDRKRLFCSTPERSVACFEWRRTQE